MAVTELRKRISHFCGRALYGDEVVVFSRHANEDEALALLRLSRLEEYEREIERLRAEIAELRSRLPDDGPPEEVLEYSAEDIANGSHIQTSDQDSHPAPDC